MSGGLLAILLSRVSFSHVLHQAARLPGITWGLGIAACAWFWVFEALRLRVLSRMIGRPLPLARAMHINLVSNVYAFVLFGWVGGGGYRAWRFSREGWNLETSIAVVIADRLFTIGGLCIASAGVFALAAEGPTTAAWSVAGAVVACAVLAVVGLPDASPITVDSSLLAEKGRWRRLIVVARVIASAGPKRIAGVFALSLLSFAVGWAWTVITARQLGVTLPWIEVAGIFGLAAIAQQVPVSWLGTGVRETSYEFLFIRKGVVPGAGMALGGVQLCISLAWTVFALLVHLIVPASAPLESVQD